MSSPLAKDTKTWLSRYLREETSFERCCRAAPNPSQGAKKPPARLQDAHDGGGVLHLHAVLPVADVIRGLVHVDAAETRQKDGVEAPLKPWGEPQSRSLLAGHAPAVLGAQPHGALVGFGVEAQQVLEAAAGEGAAAGAPQGSAIRGALAVPALSEGGGEGEEAGLLLLLRARRLRRRLLAARDFLVWKGRDGGVGW